MAVRFMAVELARPTVGCGPACRRASSSTSSTCARSILRRARACTGGSSPRCRSPMRPRPSRSPTCRRAIEQLFRTLKTQGFDIEAVRIGEDGPRSKLTMAALIAAVTIQQLVHARDGGAGQSRLRPVTDAFGPDDLPLIEALCKSLEGKTERQRNPHPRGSLAYAAWVCARLADGPATTASPGPSSCSRAGSSSKPPNAAPPSWPRNAMCRMPSPEGEVESRSKARPGEGLRPHHRALRFLPAISLRGEKIASSDRP